MSRRLRRPRRARAQLVAAPTSASPGPATKGEAEDTRVQLRARGPADLLALVPFQLGFHPTESVVAVFVRAGTVALVARVDLPPPEVAKTFAADLRRLSRRHQVDEVVLLAYSGDAGPARALLAGLVAALPRRLLYDALYVDSSRWWSMTCSLACCPPEGTPYDVEGHRLAAEAVFAGMAVRGSRAELAATFAGPGKEDLAVLTELAEEVRVALAGRGFEKSAPRLLELVQGGSIGLDDRACAELALLVADVRLRDLAWAMITPENAEDHGQLWRRVVNRASPALSAAPLALAGLAGWIAGDGAALNCAGEELARRHPDYSMGELLAMISAQAVPPRYWQAVGGEVHQELRQELERLAS